MENRVIALGFFDGVHLGHAALLSKTISRAKELGVRPAVLTFSSHPMKLTRGKSVGLINSVEERKELIRRLFGIDDIILWEFDRSLMQMGWRDFLRRTADELGACGLVAGYDYRFGHRGEGDAEKLKCWAAENRLSADIIERVNVDGQAVSSTLIRELIGKGDMEAASRFLGHPHCMAGTVHRGAQLGRTIGLPTVNLHFSDDILLPAFGVYASKVYIDGARYIGVTNIGVRPTVTRENIPKAETHILDYCGDLYGKGVYTELHKFLRGEEKFSSIDALKAQIERDISAVRAYFG